MFIKAFAICVTLSLLGVSLFEKKTVAANDCANADSSCLPLQAMASSANHLYAMLAAR